MNNQTESGIEVLGEVSWGTHLCQFYETKRDLLEILIPYFKTGLDNNEYCLWVVSSDGLINAKEAKDALAQVVPDLEVYLASGGIEILTEIEWYLEENVFDLERVIGVLDKMQKRSLLKGYTGTRVSADTLWLKEENRKEFLAYEKRLNDLVLGRRLIVLCTYPLDKCGAAVVLDVVDVHRFTIARRNEKWEVIETAIQFLAEAEIKRNKEEQVQRRDSEPHLILSYSIAVLSVMVAIIIISLAKVYLPSNVPHVMMLLCAVIFTIWRGGVGPGLFSILLSELALGYYFLSPLHPFPLNSVQFLRLLLFLVPSLFIIWLSASQKKIATSLRRAGMVLEDTVEKLKQTNKNLQEEIRVRKLAEEALRRSEDRIRLTINTIPIMAWTTEANGIADFFNQRWLDYTGLSLKEYIKDPTGLIHPADVGRTIEKWVANVTAQEPYENELRMRGADGNYRWFLIRTAPLFDAEGKLIKWYGVSIDIEDSKRLADALQQSKRRYLSLFENMAEGVAYFHMLFKNNKLQDAMYLEINSAWENLTGLKNVVGRKISEVLPGALEAKSEFFERAVRVALTGASERFETYSTVMKKWLSVSAYCPQKGDVIVVMDDITERKQAEDALRRSERVLREAESLGHTGSWEHDLVNGEFFNTGENLRLFFGDDPSKGASFEDYTQAIHPDDREFVTRRHAQLLAAGGPRDIVFRVVWPDGNVHVLLGRATVVRDELGQAIRTYGTNLDITERKKAEDELQSAYQRLSYHVENTPLAVIEFDKDLFVKRWSKRAEEVFGWSASEALGKNVYDPDFRIIYTEDVPAVDTVNEELIGGTVNWNVSMNRNYTKDGTIISCEWYNSVLKDEQGNIITILSLVHNVTERKKVEDKFKTANAELQSLSSRLQNIREIERTAIAREIHDELGQQLTGLKIDTVWIEKRITKEEKSIREKLSEMVTHINDAVKTVRRISTELRPSMLDDLGLIAALEWQAQEFEKRTGIQSQFRSNIDDLDLEVNFSTNVFRVYQEALTNVARHANATYVETVFEEGDKYINLIVKDNGQGFDLNQPRTNHSVGLIGMKERAMMLHGDLTIESNKPNGTVVFLKVPLPKERSNISQ